MKMTEQDQNKKIRDIYHNTKTPDGVKDRIEETLNTIKQQDFGGHTIHFKKRCRKSWSYRRAAAIAAAAILCKP